MAWVQVITILVGTVGITITFFLWNRRESRADIRHLSTELKKDISDLKTELKKDISDVSIKVDNVKTELKKDISDVSIKVDNTNNQLHHFEGKMEIIKEVLLPRYSQKELIEK